MSDAHRFERLESMLAHVHRRLSGLGYLGIAIMGKLEDLADAFDTETNVIAAKIDKLTADLAAAVANGQAPSQATVDKLSAISDRLKTLGADPTAPIPPPVVVPATPPAPANVALPAVAAAAAAKAKP